MALRIIYSIIALAIGFISFEIYRLHKAYDAVFDAPAEYTMGPQSADLKVVEFVDYGCSHCQTIHPVIIEAIKKDGNIQYIPRPLPSTNEGATYAAELVYSAGKQGKFFEMHDSLLRDWRVVDDGMLYAIAAAININADEAKTTAKDEDIQERINNNSRLFGLFGGQYTPLFLIDRKIIYTPTEGTPNVQDFLNMFAEARGQR